MARQYSYTVQSETNMYSYYTLTVECQIVTSCTCPAFKYNGVCKHQIKKQEEIAKRLGIDVEAVREQTRLEAWKGRASEQELFDRLA